MTQRVAVDIGGTFTDLVAYDDATGVLQVEKASSMADDPVSAVLRVIDKAAVAPADIGLFIHGTTVTTNALIQRSGTRVAFVTNRGFRDVIFIQNANRQDLYSLTWKKPRPLAARYDCLEVDCRIGADGSEVEPLDEDDVVSVIEHIASEGIGAVAVSFLFSYLNPVHEQQLGERLRAALPDVAISLSHEVYPRWRENDRGHTTIADAYLKPMFRRYTENLGSGLERSGSGARMLVMKSNGGVVDIDAAADQPTNYLVSGPVGGVLGGAHFAHLAGIDQIMTLDIGGTSCDVSLIAGEPQRAASFELELGIPICAPMIDIRTIGAGGGSIAWIDAGGLLRVGPQSAGSRPGPACYAQGGERPALTDANLLLGRLNAETFAGGDIRLDVELARTAMETVSEPLGQSVEQTADAAIQLANHNMVDALKVISVERGIDPRDFTLVAFGGAGALHAAEIALIAGIGRVLVPPYPGNTSAFGLLTAGLRADLSTTLLVRSDDPHGLDAVNSALQPLRERTTAALRREGFEGEPAIEQKLEMRYFGQNYHREIALGADSQLTPDSWADALEAFHRDHRDFYGYEQRADVIEVVGVAVAAVGGKPASIRLSGANGGAPAEETSRQAYFTDGGWTDTAIVAREALAAGTVRSGPLVVEERLSTTLVPPGATLTVHDSGSLIIDL